MLILNIQGQNHILHEIYIEYQTQGFFHTVPKGEICITSYNPL